MLNLWNITPKFHTQHASMFMSYFHIQLHMLRSYDPLVLSLKLKAKENSWMAVTLLFYILQKNYSVKVVYFWRSFAIHHIKALHCHYCHCHLKTFVCLSCCHSIVGNWKSMALGCPPMSQCSHPVSWKLDDGVKVERGDKQMYTHARTYTHSSMRTYTEHAKS
jgi:hypothetical protein